MSTPSLRTARSFGVDVRGAATLRFGVCVLGFCAWANLSFRVQASSDYRIHGSLGLAALALSMICYCRSDVDERAFIGHAVAKVQCLQVLYWAARRTLCPHWRLKDVVIYNRI